jgi:hypothetical protein
MKLFSIFNKEKPKLYIFGEDHSLEERLRIEEEIIKINPEYIFSEELVYNYFPGVHDVLKQTYNSFRTYDLCDSIDAIGISIEPPIVNYPERFEQLSLKDQFEIRENNFRLTINKIQFKVACLIVGDTHLRDESFYDAKSDSLISRSSWFRNLEGIDVIVVRSKNKEKLTESNNYKGEHEAPDKENGAPLYNLTGIYPADIYSSKAASYYGTGDPIVDAQSLAIIQSCKNLPKSKIKVYRAVPYLNKQIDNELNQLTAARSYYLKHNFLPKTDAIQKIKSKYYDESKGGYIFEWDELINKVFEDINLRIQELISMKESKLAINSGDWVTISRQYAIEHGKDNLNNNYKIITKTVLASQLYTDGNSIAEWGYIE